MRGDKDLDDITTQRQYAMGRRLFLIMCHPDAPNDLLDWEKKKLAGFIARRWFKYGPTMQDSLAIGERMASEIER